ncbi:GH92 family glycosyl hydrolase [Lysobacter capsici]|uniref:GH92 family glycosyl hydrolase n=1 Tax=Lysobacter capsici TaxID=435897 RepID=UPI00287BBB2C|nr:GH92 family glycosyl hydrolase [Lysobacter capsici]WND78627.1 GH92 family glycosyl hydrolase [Lysobacter capsici]WND83822.1 GH92 family glycosyl hydrolase [Lysobacter capsici]
MSAYSSNRRGGRAGNRAGALALIGLIGMSMAQGAAAKPVRTFWTSFEAADPPLALGPADSPRLSADGGPPAAAALTAKPEVGFSGLRSLRYEGIGGGEQQAQVFNVDIAVGKDSELSYKVFPLSAANQPGMPGQPAVSPLDNLRNASTYVAIDLLFDDGSRLSQRAPLDRHGFALTARGQGQARLLYPDQWNAVASRIGEVAAGRRIRQILVVHDGDRGLAYRGYLDDLRIGPATITPVSDTQAAQHPSDYVDTRRGSNSNSRYSRGNTFPAVALPHGFNFWTPTTNAGSHWIYQYQERNGDDNRPRIEAFALSHEPSPWMGDRQSFHILPALGAGAVELDRGKRALSFGHDQETARPDYYKVRFDNGLIAELTPTDHAAILRFTYPDARARLLFDQRDEHGDIVAHADGRGLSGWTESKSKLSTGASRLYLYARFDQPARAGKREAPSAGRDRVSAWFDFDLAQARERQVSLRIATSLISVEQAQRNLELEIAQGDSFDTVRERARAAWDAKLGIVRIDGAPEHERATLYSNLYRLFLYPNSGYENTGSAENPRYQYASPFSPATGASDGERTGAAIVDGKVYVNNGFWDTYRTAWPAYVLLTPTAAGEMIDGFVQQYRDGGWIARWSSPGYADLMVGTSSDVAFADAWLKGVRNFDVRSFYQSAIRNASSVSTVPGAGRKGIERAIFSGYADSTVDEGLSWSMDGYINDFAIGRLASALSREPAGDDPAVVDPYRKHYADDALYYRNRALGYVNLFNPTVGFFVGRHRDGRWRYTASEFDPTRWGGDYTETNAWNMAFHAPQDGAGLAALYGGRTALGNKLDQFFATPGTFEVGSYGGVIHEMIEARDVRMGQYGHSNQPSHHIPYMYAAAGQPWRIQEKVRDILDRLYVGGEIGQGYPGDEDNGEMSAWWLFSAAGFYPLRMGSPEYVIGAPRFEHMSIRLENGKELRINAPKVSERNRYVQSLKVNGQPWDRLSLPHELLAQGAVLDFRMGPSPSNWASTPQALPESLSADGEMPAPLRDLSRRDNATVAGLNAKQAAGLFDNDATTSVRLNAPMPLLSWSFKTAASVRLYTLTSSNKRGDPQAWALQGSNDGAQWVTLDERRDEAFAWRRQTRAFAIREPRAFTRYRLRLVNDGEGQGGIELAEVELLGEVN